MPSPISASEAAASKVAFERYHRDVQKWIYDQGWQSLRPLQHMAAAPVLAGEHDVVISAATASGKTEAAWLPIVSRLAFDREDGDEMHGVKALYVSPLKALINDQAMRLTSLAERAGIPVNRRHGDVQGKEREAIRKNPDGILLITPESLEAMFVLSGTQVPNTFAGLRYVVIDELHSFIGRERGAQLQSLLHRLERAIGERVPRIGLSATIADLSIAAEFMRPRNSQDTVVVEDKETVGSGARLEVRGYRNTLMQTEDREHLSTLGQDALKTDPSDELSNGAHPTMSNGSVDRVEPEGTADHAIARHLYDTLRLSTNLVFANRKSTVEDTTERLLERCDQLRTPRVFYPHHGSLSKGIREFTELRLKEANVPATAICTSTLEMGIDIGKVDSVAQLGSPGSVSGLRQRMGRSGRRGTPSVLRMYISEDELDARVSIEDELRLHLVEALAIVDLMMVDKWYEPPDMRLLHLSTLVQQILSMIAERGGSRADRLYNTLCATGSFGNVDAETFKLVLKNLAAADLIVQEQSGLLLLGVEGEKLVNHYSFYAAFPDTIEFRLIASGELLGTWPLDQRTKVGDPIVFAGRRWLIEHIDERTRVIDVVPARHRKVPVWGGGGPLVADEVRKRMRQVLAAETPIPYLTKTAAALLEEGRSAYRRYDLSNRIGVSTSKGCQIVLFRGDLLLNTLTYCLKARGIEAEHPNTGVMTSEATSLEGMRHAIHAMVHGPVPDPYEIAKLIPVKERDKYDRYLDEHLRILSAANRDILLGDTLEATREVLALGERAFRGIPRTTEPDA